MNKLRVLLFSDTLGLDSSSVYSIDVAEELIRQGHLIKFVCPGAKSSTMLDSLRKTNADPQSPGSDSLLIEISGLQTPVFSYFRRKDLSRALRGYKPDIVHATVESCAEIALKLADSYNVPCVITCHRHQNSLGFKIGKSLRRIVCVSDALREHLVNELGVQKELVSVIPNGLNLRNYETSHTGRIEGKSAIIGTLGAMVERKGHSYFLKAAAKVLESHGDAHFLIAGEGHLESQLRELADKLGITASVTFSNYPFRSHSVIREMDIFALTSIQESLGFAALEALAYGKAVVSFGIGGVYSFIREGETGLIVPVRDIDGLAHSICRLIDEPETCERLGKKGRSLVEENFSIDTVVAKLTNLYMEVIRDSKV